MAVSSLRVACELFMEAKLDALMVEVSESRKELRELEEKFSSSLSEMKREVNAAQERTAQQFSKRTGSSTYEFKRKRISIQL